MIWSQSLQDLELELKTSLTELRKAQSEEEILRLNAVFKKDMLRFLNTQGAYEYAFTQLNTVADLKSDDNLVRIVHWNLEFPDFTYTYAGFKY